MQSKYRVDHFGEILETFSLNSGLGDKIKISGGTGDEEHAQSSSFVIAGAYDGLENVCYIPGTSSNSKAQFTIPKSTVSHVKILNRRDCCR